MNLKLTRPLCFFDIETTGINLSKDRIVEIAILKLFPDGKKIKSKWLINPERLIPEEVSDIHGITDDLVKYLPNFKEYSKKIYSFIKDCDLAGYNSDRFDIPLLVEEFLRADFEIDFKNVLSIDVQTIFHKMEQRTLSAAVRFYCNKEMDNAHSALSDTIATYEVLLAQVMKYDNLEPNVVFLNEFTTRKKTVDYAGFIVYNKEGEECFGFGKHKGQLVVKILEQEPGYYGWILKSDFPRFTKKVLTEIRLRYLNTTKKQ
jgi:DNA polymerase-3 subunit epsilon